MTTKEYITALESRYPNTFIGVEAFYKQFGSLQDFKIKYSNVPLDFLVTKLISYIEYREVNFLEALCTEQITNIDISHEALRLKTITAVFNRLEKFITPAEGKPF